MYNHQLSIGFSINTKHADVLNVPEGDIVAALLSRVGSMWNAHEVHEAVQDCNDSYEFTDNEDVIVEVHEGQARIVTAPHGVKCVVRDYDVEGDDREIRIDPDGRAYVEETQLAGCRPGVIVPATLDWVQLRAQKKFLTKLGGGKAKALLALIDHVQNEAVRTSQATDEEVFGDLTLWENHYDCPCGQHWESTHECQCDDRCPECDTSCSPTTSLEA